MRTDMTRMLDGCAAGDRRASDRLLEHVYDELRALAAARLRQERPGQTLDATALVHEAYLRLLGGGDVNWANDAHFFAAAAEAMRRILIDRARMRLAAKRGGGAEQTMLPDAPDIELDPFELIALHEALDRFEATDAEKARLVKLRYFGGLTEQQAAEAMGISRATAARHWAYARAWLFDQVERLRGAQ